MLVEVVVVYLIIQDSKNDVFKVVRDYFINTQVPLLTESITPLLIRVFCHFTGQQYIDFNSSEVPFVDSKFNLSTKSSSSGVKTSTPLTVNEQNTRVNDYSTEKTSQGKILLDDPELMWDYPSTVFYETDFATSDPIHRPDSLNEDILRSKMPLKAWSSNLYLQDEIRDNKSPRKFSQLNFENGYSLDHFPSGSNVYLCEINDLDTSNLSSRTVIEVEQDNSNESFKRCNQKGLYYSSSDICNENYSSQVNQTPQTCFNQSIEKEKEYCEELKLTFQLVLLLLPSVNRRQLHLLMRLLNKVLKNGKFILNVQTSMRHYLLETFLPAIVQSQQNHMLLLEMVAFLVDNCEFLFQIPKNLKQEVEDFSRVCFGRIRYTVDDTCLLTYCEMVSKQQYEEQKVSISKEALKSLLNSIMLDQNISEKVRKRKIKQFKENHPDVYHLFISLRSKIFQSDLSKLC
ncbi:DEP domain-containing protein 1A [Caerostris extrusa]|uniref:DEP domain-containing protein 1A n=1 Tax=Caerostris extrusa TaxID=172846 RepID=A0AAV4WEH6_CAEEX|nr:DEP domain-containing protein 1A [Caerostris extrusa]